MSNRILIRFWFEFENDPINKIPMGLGYGCGVTAFDFSDALKIMKEKLFQEKDLPKIKTKVENVDVSSLDAGHVLPNMYPPNLRGIWFPIGYQNNK